MIWIDTFSNWDRSSSFIPFCPDDEAFSRWPIRRDCNDRFFVRSWRVWNKQHYKDISFMTKSISRRFANIYACFFICHHSVFYNWESSYILYTFKQWLPLSSQKILERSKIKNWSRKGKSSSLLLFIYTDFPLKLHTINWVIVVSWFTKPMYLLRIVSRVVWRTRMDMTIDQYHFDHVSKNQTGQDQTMYVFYVDERVSRLIFMIRIRKIFSIERSKFDIIESYGKSKSDFQKSCDVQFFTSRNFYQYFFFFARSDRISDVTFWSGYFKTKYDHSLVFRRYRVLKSRYESKKGSKYISWEMNSCPQLERFIFFELLYVPWSDRNIEII